ncbi:SCO6745 family protein [Nocardia huaxiensis]|uniref:Uncharacterized protein n=1 Tax=Nocardia huaxiensis TaxID=2755382 RepID=A0A7D6ZAB2_9NOCA|nr:hypothetical protein [Nocardia huaxiensis]QLY28878.1 hypothetical protein H0264_26595 [Nocardia huaxiensis]UFS97646.1 hypothetical protein LPY97_07005 [Nocardia huaxiensis]
MPATDESSRRARALRGAIEPLAGQVYFAPECHAAYERLGFAPGGALGNVRTPDAAAYFTSRGAAMGQVAGSVVAAAFAVFEPNVVMAGVDHGWRLTDAATISEARTAGAIAQLERVLGPRPAGIERVTALLARAVKELRPEGRPLFAGVYSLDLPDSSLGRAWRLADCLREYRGDSHTAAWNAAGYDAAEIGLVGELMRGLPPRTYVRSRGWTTEQLDSAHARLMARGHVDSEGLTATGAQAREAVEVATDRQLRGATDALGDDLDELVGLLGAWSAALMVNSYPDLTGADRLESARIVSYGMGESR